jgi:hypothetical protein
MKYAPLLLAFLLPQIAFGGGETQKRIRNYEIDSVKTDPALPNGFSRVIVTVKSPEDYPYFRQTKLLASDSLSISIDSLSSNRYFFHLSPGEHCLNFEPPWCYPFSIEKRMWANRSTTYISLWLETAPVRIPEVRVEYDKPVIYCYADAETEVIIRFKNPLNLKFTYPKYQEGWNFTTTTSGNLLMDGKEFRYLFWDAEMNELPSDFSTQSGALVNREDLVAFFEKNLTDLGLNTTEQQDFITYWVPQMLKYEKLFIHFALQSYNEQVPLDIQPQPDWLQRVLMVWCNGSHISDTPTPQSFNTNPRHGFSVLEWGGAQLPDGWFKGD